MRVGVMTTNGGPHPADKWASETAGEIISYVKVDDNADTPEAALVRRAKPRLELDIAEALEDSHRVNILAERAALAIHDTERLSQPFEVDEDHLDSGTEAVVSVAKKYGAPFADAFDSDNGRSIVRQALKVHFTTAHDVERGWHADRAWAAGRIDDHVKAFKAMGR